MASPVGHEEVNRPEGAREAGLGHHWACRLQGTSLHTPLPRRAEVVAPYNRLEWWGRPCRARPLGVPLAGGFSARRLPQWRQIWTMHLKQESFFRKDVRNMHTHKRRLLLALLGLLLVVVVAAGVFLLTGRPKTEESSPVADAPAEEQPGKAAASLDWLTDLSVRYRLADQTEEEARDVRGWWRFFTVQDTVYRFSYTGKPDALFQLISMEDGIVRRDYDESCFLLGAVHSRLYLDSEGQLWTLADEGTCYWFALCEPGAEEKATKIELPYDATGKRVIRFELWQGYLLLQYSFVDEYMFAVINRETGAFWTMDHVQDFCVDSDGALYCKLFWKEEEYPWRNHHVLERRSLRDGEVLWSQKAWTEADSDDFPVVSGMCTLDGAGLFVLGKNLVSSGITQTGIYRVNTETGAVEDLLTDFWVEGIALDVEIGTGGSYSLAADSSGKFYFGMAGGTPETDYRRTWTLEPYFMEVNPSEMVTLTITAPYPVESISNSVRMYQRAHPEVQIVWDAQYASREEFQKNAMEYKEQITLRTITGDTGDLQMIVGAGISQDVITDTDSFTDLGPYLEASPVKEELAWNLVKTLQGEDGAIRALPLGIIPACYLYNQTLLEKQGIPLNLDAVTWSELLELAAQWKARGTDLSLTSCAPGGEENAKYEILSSLLLANLYDSEQPDGTVQLDQPYLRELLIKLKTVWDAPQLVRTDGNRFTKGFFEKSLFTSYDRTVSQSDRLSATGAIAEEEKVKIGIAPRPRGEVYKKQQGYGFCWGIPAASQQKDEAWNLLEFMISSDGLVNYAYSGETETVNNVAQENWYADYETWRGPGRNRGIFDQFQALRQYPYARFDEIYGWSDAVQAPIADYLNGKLTLDEAMEIASDNWSRLMMG